MQELTYEFLNEILEYAPETGEFFWKKPVAKRIKPGQKAGSMTPTGYMKVSINNKKQTSSQNCHMHEHWRNASRNHDGGSHKW